MIVPVILSGGSGTRLWPLSNVQRPKQFLPLTSEYTLLQETVHRLDNIEVECAPPLIVCNEAHRSIIQEQLVSIDREAEQLICEPEGRNTAPAVAAAALLVRQKYPDAQTCLMVLPADQSIKDLQCFSSAVAIALRAAQEDFLVTFGVVPDKPETGYGYIKKGSKHGEVYSVESFVEKPDLNRAISYLKSQDYYWNSGIFLFNAETYLKELKKFAPEILRLTRLAVDGASTFSGGIQLEKESFFACPGDSIDYAVMEHTNKAVVVPLSAGWNDVGSWDRLHDFSDHDEAGNSIVGNALVLDCENSYLRSNNRPLVAIGLSDLIVIDSPDALLVASLSKAQEVAKAASVFNTIGASEEKLTCLIDSTASYKVVKLHLTAGARVALDNQKALLESAHCLIVLEGEAHVVIGPDTLPIATGKPFEVTSDAEIEMIFNAGFDDLTVLVVLNNCHTE